MELIVIIAVIAIVFYLRSSIKSVGKTAETVINTTLTIADRGAKHMDDIVVCNIAESQNDIVERLHKVEAKRTELGITDYNAFMNKYR